MKKIIIIFGILVLASCNIGDFGEKRNSLHERSVPNCEEHPEKCINGVPW